MQDKIPKTALILSSLFMITSFAGLFLSAKMMNTKNEKFQKAQIEFHTEEKRREEIQQLDRAMRALEGERKMIDSHFARSSDVVPFLDTLEALASSVSVKAEISSVETSKNNLNLTVGIKASGTFESLYKFLILLENSPYELDFLSMDLQSTSTDTSKSSDSDWGVVFKVKLVSFLP